LIDEIKLEKTINADSFFIEIEKIVQRSDKSITFIDAVVYWCEKNDIEIETIASIIKNNAKFKSTIQYEGEELNFLPKTARLPI
jgi:hypothetical protein